MLVCQVPEELQPGEEPVPAAPRGVPPTQDLRGPSAPRGGPLRQGMSAMFA